MGTGGKRLGVRVVNEQASYCVSGCEWGGSRTGYHTEKSSMTEWKESSKCSRSQKVLRVWFGIFISANSFSSSRKREGTVLVLGEETAEQVQE